LALALAAPVNPARAAVGGPALDAHARHDRAQIARACGWRGIGIEDGANFFPARKEAAGSKMLTMLDIITHSAAIPGARVRPARSTGQ
jgi:thiamine pyrophosphate-dependent acetolactate synthase large subunit-like protein